jgi:hypothetical protein
MMKELQGVICKTYYDWALAFFQRGMPSVSIRTFLYEFAPANQLRVPRKLILQVHVLKYTRNTSSCTSHAITSNITIALWWPGDIVVVGVALVRHQYDASVMF